SLVVAAYGADRRPGSRSGVASLGAHLNGGRRTSFRLARPLRCTGISGRLLALAGPPSRNVIRRRRLHRAVFLLAGFYNIAWGIYSAADPQWLFRYAGMPPINHPAIFACLGMVVGLYGI